MRTSFHLLAERELNDAATYYERGDTDSCCYEFEAAAQLLDWTRLNSRGRFSIQTRADHSSLFIFQWILAELAIARHIAVLRHGFHEIIQHLKRNRRSVGSDDGKLLRWVGLVSLPIDMRSVCNHHRCEPMSTIALISCHLPTRWAMRVDPLVTLRHDQHAV